MIIPPGSTIGILGGGQLGRMLAIAAAQLGYRTHIYAPEASGPAAEVAAAWTQAGYGDEGALARFASTVDVVTYEFENIDPVSVAFLSSRVATAPGTRSLEVSRYRPHEKAFVEELGGRCARYAVIESAADLAPAADRVGAPAILKTCSLGYDGKGQARIGSTSELADAWESIGRGPAILEQRIDFTAEFSVILARARDGGTVVYDVPHNVHRDGILHRSTVPAPAAILAQADAAVALAKRVADALGYVGVLTLEYFATDDGPLFNEMAPRVHNSGHWTIEGAVTSQFENHIRALCGLPLGSTALVSAGATMENLIGEEANDWAKILADPSARLHLYGKREIRAGRKMGHVTRVRS